MAIAETWRNKTYTQRLQRQDEHAGLLASMTETPLNRAQRRRLAKAGRILPPGRSKREIRKAAKKDGSQEALSRRVAFFGPDYVFPERVWRIGAPKTAREEGFLHTLNADEEKAWMKRLRKARAAKVADKP